LTSLSTNNLKPIKNGPIKNHQRMGRGISTFKIKYILSTSDNGHVECKLLATLHEFETSLH
jgi:hypothetical protein